MKFDGVFSYGDEKDGKRAVDAFEKSYGEDDEEYTERKQREQELRDREWAKAQRIKELQELTRRLEIVIRERQEGQFVGALRSCWYCGGNTNSEDSGDGRPICGACWPTQKSGPSATMMPARTNAPGESAPVQAQKPEPAQPYVEPAKGRAAVVKGEECP